MVAIVALGLRLMIIPPLPVMPRLMVMVWLAASLIVLVGEYEAGSRRLAFWNVGFLAVLFGLLVLAAVVGRF